MSYIKYDSLGILEVCCLSCGNPVAVRSFSSVKIKSIPPRTENIMTVKKLSSWRQRKVILDDGSYMEIILCSNCENLEIPFEKIESEISKAWKDTLKQEGKTDYESKRFIKSFPKIEQNSENINKFKKAELERKG